MTKTLTASKTLDAPLSWDARPFSLTLAGCLHLAGLPLASDAVAEVKPKTTAEIMNDPNRIPAPASCRVCQFANLHGCLSCRDERCPNPLPQSENEQQAARSALEACWEELDRLDSEPLASYRQDLDCTCGSEPSPNREAFHITDEGSANWYLRRLATIASEKSRISAQTEKMIAELDADAAGLKFLYQHELEAWVKAELSRKGDKKKTLHLLQATCAFRLVPASVKVADLDAALEYAKESGLPCIVTSERVDCEAYKQLAEGVLLPGMEMTPERENFSVKFGGKNEG